MSPRRVVALLVLAFLSGGGSAEVAVQTSRAVARARAEHQVGSAGDLVAVELLDEDGQLFARPRLIAPIGRAAHLVLRDPSNPDEVRLSLRVETAREPHGDILLAYALELPSRSISTSGRLSMTPGVEQAVELGDGAMTARLLALPVPSAAFDAYVEAGGVRRSQPNAI
jgi:hypothetical protein